MHDVVVADPVIARLTNARNALAEARTIQDTKKVVDVATAAEVYARRQQLSQDSIDYAHTIKIEALAQLGKMLQETPKATGAAGIGPNAVPDEYRNGQPPRLSDIGITKKVSSVAQKLASLPKAQFEAVRQGHATVAKAIKQVHAERRQDELEAAQRSLDSAAKSGALREVFDARHCSCAELMPTITPDAIITDPPYPREFLPVYGELAELAKNVPLVAVMCGQSYLPEVLAAMSSHLTYRWTLAYMTPGGQAVQLWQAKVNTFWKPVLLFGDALEWLGDVAQSRVNDNDKQHHEWGQSESGMYDLLQRLVKPGSLICDPFMGAGTTAIAALKHGCRFVGCDIDEKHVQTTRQRVERMYA